MRKIDRKISKVPSVKSTESSKIRRVRSKIQLKKDTTREKGFFIKKKKQINKLAHFYFKRMVYQADEFFALIYKKGA